MLRYCPMWIYSAVCSLSAQRYLSENLGLEAYAGKYANELSLRYADISSDMILDTSESYLRHLMDAEIENASEVLDAFAFKQLTYEANGLPRKIRSFFSSSLDGLKAPEINIETADKEFKPFIYMFRAKPELAPPAGWNWTKIEDGEFLQDFPNLEVSFLDGI